MSTTTLVDPNGSTLTLTRTLPAYTLSIELQSSEGAICEFAADAETMRALVRYLSKAVQLADSLEKM